jgi:hypothetical protein
MGNALEDESRRVINLSFFLNRCDGMEMALTDIARIQNIDG